MPLRLGTVLSKNGNEGVPKNGTDKVMVNMLNAGTEAAEEASGMPSEPRFGAPTIDQKSQRDAAGDEAVFLAYLKEIPESSVRLRECAKVRFYPPRNAARKKAHRVLLSMKTAMPLHGQFLQRGMFRNGKASRMEAQGNAL